MKATILLNYNENTKQVEEEEKTRYLRTLLEQIGVPIQEFWSSEIQLSTEQKIKLRDILSQYNINVIDSLDGLFQIYVENKLIAEFLKPTYKLKRDLREIDPRKQLYLEMTIETKDLLENNESIKS